MRRRRVRQRRPASTSDAAEASSPQQREGGRLRHQEDQHTRLLVYGHSCYRAVCSLTRGTVLNNQAVPRASGAACTPPSLRQPPGIEKTRQHRRQRCWRCWQLAGSNSQALLALLLASLLALLLASLLALNFMRGGKQALASQHRRQRCWRCWPFDKDINPIL
jgi:hypothetical protein